MMAARPDRPWGAGVGLKPAHYGIIGDVDSAVGWFEVHPENYMGAGGPPHHYLTRVRERHPLSLHGVGLSIGGAGDLDADHLGRLKALVERYEPGLVSEHLAWSTHQGRNFNDLLALPYTRETLDIVCAHLGQVQDVLGRRVLLENPATYVRFHEDVYDEIDFLKAVATRTGCGLLLDVNNVHVTCTNHDQDAETYVDRFPIDRVEEIHLAGHGEDRDVEGGPLLIDSHDRPVDDRVWVLYERVLDRAGPVPTLIEWDNDIPSWAVLLAEAQRAARSMRKIERARDKRHVA